MSEKEHEKKNESLDEIQTRRKYRDKAFKQWLAAAHKFMDGTFNEKLYVSFATEHESASNEVKDGSILAAEQLLQAGNQMLYWMNEYLADDPLHILQQTQPKFDSFEEVTESDYSLQRSLQQLVYENNIRRHPLDRVALYLRGLYALEDSSSSSYSYLSGNSQKMIHIATSLSFFVNPEPKDTKTILETIGQTVKRFDQCYARQMHATLSHIQTGTTVVDEKSKEKHKTDSKTTATSTPAKKQAVAHKYTHPHTEMLKPFEQLWSEGFPVSDHVLHLIYLFRSDVLTLFPFTRRRSTAVNTYARRLARLFLHYVHLLLCEPCDWSTESVPLMAMLVAVCLHGAESCQPYPQHDAWRSWLYTCAIRVPFWLLLFVRKILQHPNTCAEVTSAEYLTPSFSSSSSPSNQSSGKEDEKEKDIITATYLERICNSYALSIVAYNHEYDNACELLRPMGDPFLPQSMKDVLKCSWEFTPQDTPVNKLLSVIRYYAEQIYQKKGRTGNYVTMESRLISSALNLDRKTADLLFNRLRRWFGMHYVLNCSGSLLL